MKLVALSIVGICLFSGCGVLHPGIPGSGRLGTEVRQISGFDEIKLAGFGTVNVVVGEQPAVQVTTDDNLLRYIDTYVEDGKLKIKPQNGIRPRNDLIVDVTVPRLTSAKVSGAGNINVYAMTGDNLDLSVSGAGDLTAYGQVRHISTKISGAGSANLQQLIAESARVRISGAGSASVYASDSIDARVSGAGDVVCYGNPLNVSQKISGAGSLTTKK